MRLDTSGSSYPTWVAVYTGTRGDLNEVACGKSRNLRLDFTVATGTTYYIESGGDDGDTGTLVLSLSVFSRG
jgi:alanyl-tRNA synthetase